jgi:hypothetical protein
MTDPVRIEKATPTLSAMSRSLFSFPNPVNDVAARTVAAGVIVMAVVALGAGALWLTIPLAYGFVARTATGPTLSPLGTFASRVVGPRLGRQAKLVPGPPKRFAQAIGATFTCAALGCWLGGDALAARVLLGALLVPALLEAVFGYCIGCVLFGRLMSAGMIPESVCAACSDLSLRLNSR